MAADRKTLEQFLAETQFPEAVSAVELRELLLDIANLCRTIGCRATDVGGAPGDGQEGFVLLTGLDGDPGSSACGIRRGRHLVALLPVDNASGVEANAPRGTIFSVLRADGARREAAAADFVQSGSKQLCAGYAIYGPSILLVLALGPGVQGFTLDMERDAFVLTHADIRIPVATREIAIDASNTRFWRPAIRRYVDECLAGEPGPRGRDFRFHWHGSIVAETHRILMCGGVFICPGDCGAGGDGELPRLLHEANPIAFIVERAGGRAGTGSVRILDVEPDAVDRRTPLVFGATEEVERVEAYRRDHEAGRYDAPLFAERGLFRVTV